MRTGFVLILGLIVLSSCSTDGSRISGVILGADGRPMAMAHAHLMAAAYHGIAGATMGMEYEKDLLCVPADSAGRFDIRCPNCGAFFLTLTGVGHQRLDVPLLLSPGARVGLQARLGVLRLNADTETVEIAYDYENVARGTRVILHKGADGALIGEIHHAQSPVRYRLPNVCDDPLACFGTIVLGANADGYEPLEGGGYTAILRLSNGIARVRISPSVTASLPAVPVWRFDDTNSVHATFAAYCSRLQQWENDCDADLRNHIASGGAVRSFVWDWRGKAGVIAADLRAAKDRDLRNELILELMDIAGKAPDIIDQSALGKHLADVPASSPVWEFHGSLALQAPRFHPEGKAYLDSILSQSRSREYKASLVYSEAMGALRQQDFSRYDNLIDRLFLEYPDTRAGRTPAPRPRTRLQIGDRLPAFSFPSLDEPGRNLTNESFRGKFLFIDSWTTSCGPCIGQMKELHELHREYHEKGLGMLSVSFDSSPRLVRYFRQTKWPMPWANTVIPADSQASVCWRFEFGSPTNILVDPDGIIVMLSDGARPDLESVVSRLLSPYRQRRHTD